MIARGESHASSKLTEVEACEIIFRRRQGETISSIALTFPHVSRSTVFAVISGRNWPHLGAGWVKRGQPTDPLRRSYHQLPEEVRFWKHVDQRGADECWPWQRAKSAHGYGVFRLSSGKNITASRYAAKVAGILSDGDGLHACHHCDNPACCNPRHLFAGTPADNCADKLAKGRGAKGARIHNARLTESDVLEIRASICPEKELAKRFGISRSHVADIRHKRRWKHVE